MLYLQRLINRYTWILPILIIVGTTFCLIALPESRSSRIEIDEPIIAQKPFWFTHSTLEGVFVRDIFRTKKDEIVLFFLKDFRNKIELEIKIDDEFIPVKYDCYYDVCQGTFDQCTYQDYMATIKINSSSTNELVTVRLSEDSLEHTFKLIDVRPQANYKHRLGVILQPAYYLADWQNLIQFIESWLANGATKFYIYHYSWTKQVANVINFYKEQMGDDFEILPWSSLPVREVDKGRFSADPNTRMFNLVSEAAMNNALYRSKGTVKFMAMMDLDEIMTVSNNRELVPLLDKLSAKHPQAAQFSFEWIHSTVQVPLELYEKPKDLNFDYLKAVKPVTRDSLAEIYFTSRKVIHMTEKVELLDTHNTLRNKFINGTEVRFNTTYISKDIASVLHNRRIFDLMNTEDTQSDLMPELAEEMTENYMDRIANSTFSEIQMSPWVSEYKETLRTLHDCRRVTMSQYRQVVRGGLTQCRSVRGCEQFLGGQEHFIYASNCWTNLASRFDVLGDIFPLKI